MVVEEYAGLLPGGQEPVMPARYRRGERRGGRRLMAVSLLSILVLLGGCLRPEDGPPSLPEALLPLLGIEEPQPLTLSPGLAYFGIKSPSQPWAIHLLRVEMGRCELGLHVLEAPVSAGAEIGRSRVTELLAEADGDFLAAVNGDFFTPEGMPLGTEVVSGEVRRVRDRPAFAWRPEGKPWVGTPRVEGDSVLLLGWRLPQPGGDRLTEVVGGFPLLLEDGLRVGDLEVSDRPSFAAARHPRTAVGFDSDGDVLWVVVVDGRQPDLSVGMTLPELAELMEALGVEEAVNLDGGGSSVMVLEGKIVNSPSDPEGERPVVNALGIRRDPGRCPVGG
jgi:hypothetical protein